MQKFTRKRIMVIGGAGFLGPRSCYDEGNRCEETLFFDYYRQHGLRIKVARIFNTYGPGMHPNDGRVVSNNSTGLEKNEPIIIYAMACKAALFCYVDDMIEAFIRLMETAGKITGPINLGIPVNLPCYSLPTWSSSKLALQTDF